MRFRLICPSCTVKCGNKHCAYSYNLIEACQSGKSFKRKDSNITLKCLDDGFFRYLIDIETNQVYNPTQEDFLSDDYILL